VAQGSSVQVFPRVVCSSCSMASCDALPLSKSARRRYRIRRTAILKSSSCSKQLLSHLKTDRYESLDKLPETLTNTGLDTMRDLDDRLVYIQQLVYEVLQQLIWSNSYNSLLWQVSDYDATESLLQHFQADDPQQDVSYKPPKDSFCSNLSASVEASGTNLVMGVSNVSHSGYWETLPQSLCCIAVPKSPTPPSSEIGSDSLLMWKPGAKSDFIRLGSDSYLELREAAAVILQRFHRRKYMATDQEAFVIPTGEVLMQAAQEKCPQLASKWSRCIDVMNKLPDEAFSVEQRPWLAKLISDHMEYTSLALQVADGLVTTRHMISEELQREMYIEFRDETDTT